jgi:hypothetical protein
MSETEGKTCQRLLPLSENPYSNPCITGCGRGSL